MWRLLTFLTLPPLGIVFSLVLLYDISFWDAYSKSIPHTYFHRDYAFLLIVSLFSFIGLLWTIVVLARQQKLEQQNAFADINNSYYEAMEQHYFEIRRLKHDMANHLSILSALPREEQQTYLESLAKNAALTQTLHYCGDATVNAVLAVKENQMNRYGIHLAYSIDIPKELPFEQIDICALFANALDNAMEACRNLQSGNKEIILESTAQKGLFCLNVKNPASGFDHEIRYDSKDGGPMPATSKQNKQAHGLGLKSMLEIVTRYQGQMELKTENETVELFLYMPMRNGE